MIGRLSSAKMNITIIQLNLFKNIVHNGQVMVKFHPTKS